MADTQRATTLEMPAVARSVPRGRWLAALYMDPTLPPEVVEQLVFQLYRSPWQMLNAIFGTCVLAAFAIDDVPPVHVFVWMGAVISVCGIRLAVWARFWRAAPAGLAALPWSNTFVALSTLTGLLIGSAALFMFETPDTTVNVTILLLSVGVGCGAASVYAMDLRVAIGFLITAFIPPILVSLAIGDKMHFVFAVLLSLMGPNLGLISRSAHRTLVRAMLLRHEKEVLARALEAEKTRSETASQAKSGFLATMSHELRTPLNAIIGFSELMIGETFGPMGHPRYAEYCRDIHASANMLVALINDILDTAKVEAGKYALREEPLDLAEIAKSVGRLVQTRATQKEIAFALTLGPVPLVWGDERAIRQICLNLLSNAIKFTPKGGRVELATWQGETAEVVIEVRDNGIGIPEQDQTAVLSDFGRASNAHLSGEGGTGLGLSIVRGLVHLHGGELTLQSTVGIGTAVRVILPAARVWSAEN